MDEEQTAELERNRLVGCRNRMDRWVSVLLVFGLVGSCTLVWRDQGERFVEFLFVLCVLFCSSTSALNGVGTGRIQLTGELTELRATRVERPLEFWFVVAVACAFALGSACYAVLLLV